MKSAVQPVMLIKLMCLAFVLTMATILALVAPAAADTSTTVPGLESQVVDGPDGTSIIVDVDSDRNRIVVHPCVDRKCSSWTTTVLDVSAGRYASDWFVRSSHDGRIFVVFPAFTGAVLIACNQPLCADGTTTTTTLPGSGPTRVRVTSDGLLAARVHLDGAFHAIYCTNPTCTTSVVNPLPVADGIVDFVDDEFVMTRFDSATSVIETIRCIDRCASSIVTTGPIPATVFEGSPRRSFTFRMPNDPQRLVHLLLRQGDDGPTSSLIDCLTLACAEPVVTPFIGAIPYNSTGIAVNDLGHIVYLAGNQVVTCQDTTCSLITTGGTLQRPLHLKIDELGRPSVMSRSWFVTCDSRSCGEVEFAPSLHGRCVTTYGIIDVAVRGPGEWSIRSGQAETSRIQYRQGLPYIRMTGRNGNAPAGVVVLRDGAEVASGVINFACGAAPDHDASWTCQAERGRIDVRVASAQIPRDFDVFIGDLAPRRITIDATTVNNETRLAEAPAPGSIVTTATQIRDGLTTVRTVDVSSGVEVFRRTLDTNCGFQSLDEPTHTIVSTCLANNARIDTNIVNRSGNPARFTVALYPGDHPHVGVNPRLAQLARARTVDQGDWWRLPMTGRHDGVYTMVIQQDRVEIGREVFTVSCDAGVESVDEPEVQVVNACRNGLGYVLFLFANDTDASKSWVLEFTGVPNRSTSAGPYAQSVKAVTGRPPGVYTATVNATMEFTIDVRCPSIAS